MMDEFSTELGAPAQVVYMIFHAGTGAMLCDVEFIDRCSPDMFAARHHAEPGEAWSGGGLQGRVAGIGAGLTLQAVVHLIWLRRQVWPPVDAQAAPPRVASTSTDPAVAAVLVARSRRADARRIVNDDPLLACELRIGRPDLPPEMTTAASSISTPRPRPRSRTCVDSMRPG